MQLPFFVYGSLRPHNDNPMSRWLADNATYHGPACATGALYLVADYPGFVPGSEGIVKGDLFQLHAHDAALAILDDYEECTPSHPPPHEYRRARITVHAAGRDVDAGAYLYMLPVDALPRIRSGDFNDRACVSRLID